MNRPFRILPDEYIELDYIESTGTQYIDTGFAPQGTDTGFDIRYSYTQPRNYETAIGVLRSAGVGYFGLATSTSQVYRYWGDGVAKSTTIEKDRIYHVTENYMNDKKFIWDDGILSWDLPSTTSIATGNIWLFRFNPGGYTGTNQPLFGKMYRCTITNQNNVVRDYFPAIRKSDNAVGMYDRITKLFFINNGTGHFIAGNEVIVDYKIRSQKVPTEYIQLDNLESTGSEFINTKVQYQQGDTIDLVGRFLKPNHDDGLIVMIPWNTPNPSRFMFAVATSGVTPTFTMAYNELPGGSNRPSYALLDSDFHRWHYENLTLTIDDGLIEKTNNAPYNQGSGTLYLFRRFNGGCATSIKYYRHWRNGELIADFVPVKRKSDNVLGMYDLVSNTFFKNDGTGNFIAGNEIIKNYTKEIKIPEGNVAAIKVNGKIVWHKLISK